MNKVRVPIILFCILLSNCDNHRNKNLNTQKKITSESHLADTIQLNSLSQEKQGSVDESWEYESNDVMIKQIKLSLDNKEGVPYFEDELLGKIVVGFDVDVRGDFYFISGDHDATLVKYSGTEPIFREKYEDISPGTVSNINDSIMVLFSRKYGKNELFWINNRNGEITRSIGKILDNTIDQSYINDSTLIVKAFNITDSVNMNTGLGVLRFDLNGSVIGYANNLYGVSEDLIRIGIDAGGASRSWLLGFWKENYVKLVKAVNGVFNFYLIDKSIEVVDINKIAQGKLKEALYGNFHKLVNDKLYVMNVEENEVTISIVNIEDCFKKFEVDELLDDVTQEERARYLKMYFKKTFEEDSILNKTKFFDVFPETFADLRLIYGYKEEGNSIIKAPLYEKAENHILGLFNELAPIVGENQFYEKVLNICIGGIWQADAVGYLRRSLKVLVEKKTDLMFNLFEHYSEEEKISIWRFYFDGPPYGIKQMPENILSLKEQYPSEFVLIEKGLQERNEESDYR